MANCPACGRELRPGAKFCGSCGKLLDEPAPVAPACTPATYSAGVATYTPTPAAYGSAASSAPAGGPPAYQLATNRALWKFVVFGLLTAGLYNMIIMSNMVDDVNIIASRYDGQRTKSYWIANFLLAPITLFIYSLVWGHTLYRRIGQEQTRRGTTGRPLTAGAFWMNLIPIVGPFISTHKLCVAQNQIAADYNYRG